MDSRAAIVLLIVVSAGALVFMACLIQDYFSRQARAVRRRKRAMARKLKRIRDHSKVPVP